MSRTASATKVTTLIWLLLAFLVIIGYVHLTADFPNFSRFSDDPAKFTDEGWWASGAINHIFTGHWLRFGDYNPMLAVPLWSVVLEFFFHFAGFSITLARGLAFTFTLGTVIGGGLLMARNHRPYAPLFMLLLAASPTLFIFSHIAILEPMLIFLLTCSALAACPSSSSSSASSAAFAADRPGIFRLILCGVCLTLAILTKSTALFTAPAIFYLIWFPYRESFSAHAPADPVLRRRALVALAIPAVIIVFCYGLYWLLVIRTHPLDVFVFYNETSPALNLRSFEKAVRVVYRCFTWIDPIFFSVAVLAVVASFSPLPFLREKPLFLRKDPLFGFAALFFLGYCAFMVWHVDAGPRYFTVLVLPVMILVTLLLEGLGKRSSVGFNALAAVIALTVLANVSYLAWRVAHPEYTLRDASLEIRSRILAGSGPAPLVIGHGAVEMTYFTRIPALDDFGFMPVAEKLAIYHPDWLLTFNDNCNLVDEPGVLPNYIFTPVASYRVFDNTNRDRILLFHIDRNPAFSIADEHAEQNSTPPTLSRLREQAAQKRRTTLPCSDDVMRRGSASHSGQR